MRIVITGATGLIGAALCKKLYPDYEIIALSRHPEKSRFSQNITVVQWDAHSAGPLSEYIDGALAVINLAGESIASGRWTPAKKRRILQSRLDATKAVVEAIASAKQKPEVLIQASAIGYYGFDCPGPVDENACSGSGYLAEVCKKWEQSSKPVEQFKSRLVIVRTGLVLSGDGGVLPRLVTPFKFFLGGYPGSGEQWVSWITIDDEIAAIRFLLENQELSGVFNLVSPNAVIIRQLCRTIGRVLKRPCRLPIPALVLRLAFGKMADETILADEKVIPGCLLESGFKFSYPNIADALNYILKKRRKDELG